MNIFVFDVTKKFPKAKDAIPWLKEHFGIDKYPYNGTKRYGDDSSTDYMDLTYADVNIGDCFYIEDTNYIYMIEIIDKHRYILFYNIQITGDIGYIDCGACSNDPNYKYHAIPKHTIYPMKVIVPNWIDISSWHLPIETEIIYE